MELTVNTAKSGLVNNAETPEKAENGISATQAQSTKHASGEQPPNVLVTEGADAPGDDFAVQAAAIPPETFSRDDGLGRLVASTFTLPPPPMPDFQ